MKQISIQIYIVEHVEYRQNHLKQEDVWVPKGSLTDFYVGRLPAAEAMHEVSRPLRWHDAVFHRMPLVYHLSLVENIIIVGLKWFIQAIIVRYNDFRLYNQ